MSKFMQDLYSKPQGTVVVMFHNGGQQQEVVEEEFDVLQYLNPDVHFMKVNTLEAPQIKEQYADGNSKPYFKFFKAAKETDYVKYDSWEK